MIEEQRHIFSMERFYRMERTSLKLKEEYISTTRRTQVIGGL